MEGLARFREAVAGAVAGFRVQKKAAAKEVAQREVAMQRRFLAAMSHELRTPLNVRRRRRSRRAVSRKP